LGRAINAVTGTRRFGLWTLVFPLSEACLTRCRQGHAAAVVQWFVDFCTHPKVMQQHRELFFRDNDGSLLAAFPTLGQLQPPGSQITVHPKRPQNVLRPLQQQRAQIGIAFLADVYLRLALAGVSASRLQSQVAPTRASCENDVDLPRSARTSERSVIRRQQKFAPSLRLFRRRQVNRD
jgi:hypothetical protein